MSDREQQIPDRWLKIGAVGAIITAVCCFTPVLVIIFSALGIAVITAWLDFILLPLLAVFLILIGWSLWKRHQIRSS
jgi:mercuric ion transport protein